MPGCDLAETDDQAEPGGDHAGCPDACDDPGDHEHGYVRRDSAREVRGDEQDRAEFEHLAPPDPVGDHTGREECDGETDTHRGQDPGRSGRPGVEGGCQSHRVAEWSGVREHREECACHHDGEHRPVGAVRLRSCPVRHAKINIH